KDHRVADLFSDLERVLDALQHASGAGQHRDTALTHEGPRLFLDAHQADDVRARSDEFKAGGLADFREAGVLAEKSVAGVDGVDIRDFGGADDGRHVQVTAGAFGRPDADRLVGEADVGTVAVGFGVDGDGLDAEFFAGGDDTDGNFAAVGD